MTAPGNATLGARGENMGGNKYSRRNLNFERQLGLKGMGKPIAGEKYVWVAKQLHSDWIAAAGARSDRKHRRTQNAVITCPQRKGANRPTGGPPMAST